ncbi:MULTISPECIES: GNAT family N-acetyltransferase [unclassified Acinetobacter]|uniref:GNAT family N-acetyltransferase n=1 Tax=unclassified Acinetobacter TaxID=196816 RepID=UPI0015D3F5FD|nr:MULTISPECIES: GNAT family N-acetyltransferase [unclassified Acinetobacter]
MYTIEHARILDIPELLEIAVQFWNESPNYKKRPVNLDKVKTQLQALILFPTQGCVLVVKDDNDKIIGVFVGGLQEEWQADSLMAFDYCLFVRANNRGGRAAYMLITAFKEWAKQAGADWIQCGTATGIQTDKTINFYTKMGFQHTGSFLEMKL